jgi:glycolate oxidase FAD binding subunit
VVVAGPEVSVDGVEPRLVEEPASAEDLARRLAEATGDGLAVIPVGGGRALGMGDPPDAFDLAIRTRKLDRVVEHSPHDLTLTVEAGVTLEEVQRQLAGAKQFLPLDPFASPGHTIGGLLATGWSGPLRLRYGTAREFLIGLRVALPDGTLAASGGRVVKNVSGYDMNKLHLGALGALGVIVTASFKVYPLPLSERTLRREAGNRDEALAEARRALALPMAPAALDVVAEGGGFALLARLTGSEDGVARIARELGWQEAPDGAWDEHCRRSAPTWARLSARPGSLPDLLDALPAGAAYVAHAGSGVVHWFDAGPADAIRAARRTAESLGGSCVLLAAPPEVKRELGAWGDPPPTIELMRRLRDAFDPDRRLSPGRYVV